jgi:two-component system, LytTR family, response regulator
MNPNTIVSTAKSVLNAVLADDEASAHSRLRRLLLAHANITVVGEARDGLQAVQQIETLRPDVVFLDIEMPGLNGLEVLRALPPGTPAPLVIFVTGYDEHALAAFEANALAYLLKPVDPEQLARAVERAEKLNAFAADREKESDRVLRIARAAPMTLRQVVCRKHDRVLLVPPDQILWFEVESGIVKAKTASDSYWVNYSLGDLETALSPEQFFRARREVLVNLSGIREVRPYFKSGLLLIMSDAAATEIVVSERRVPALREQLPGL